MAVPLNGGLLILLCVAPPLSALLYWACPRSTLPQQRPRRYRAGRAIPAGARARDVLFMGANFAFRGYWNAVDLPRLYMTTLIAMHASTSSSTGC
jgi:multidrug resistance protein, MATE family